MNGGAGETVAGGTHAAMRGAGLGTAWVRRGLPAALLAASVAVLAVAYGLHPDASGVGTHEQLGLPACGFLQATRVPCATCGMTTAFSHAAHGQLVTAFIVQPVGAAMALGTAVTAIVAGYALVSGASLRPIGRRLWRPRTFIVAAALVLSAWVYKIVLITWSF